MDIRVVKDKKRLYVLFSVSYHAVPDYEFTLLRKQSNSNLLCATLSLIIVNDLHPVPFDCIL